MSDDAPSRSEEEGYYSEQGFIGKQYRATKEAMEKLQKVIDEGWTSDGEFEYIIHIGPRQPQSRVFAASLAEYLETVQAKELLALPPGVDSSSDLGDADLTDADLTGATMPDGSIHD